MNNIKENKFYIIQKIILFLLILISTSNALPENLIKGAPETKYVDWSWSGIWGVFDRSQLQRGYQVYKETCANCHSMNLIKFRNLSDTGGPEFSKKEVKLLAAEYEIKDGPNIEGDMFFRSRLPKDSLPAPFINDSLAKLSNNGALPPDLSLIAKARGNFSFKDLFKGYDGSISGPNYIYNLLTGYENEIPQYIIDNNKIKNDKAIKSYNNSVAKYYKIIKKNNDLLDYPEKPKKYNFDLGDNSFNNYFPGNKIAMPPPLVDNIVKYNDGTKETVEQYAEDVSTFLMWAAEPKMEERKRIGIKVLLYLIILACLMYGVKKCIWKSIRH